MTYDAFSIDLSSIYSSYNNKIEKDLLDLEHLEPWKIPHYQYKKIYKLISSRMKELITIGSGMPMFQVHVRIVDADDKTSVVGMNINSNVMASLYSNKMLGEYIIQGLHSHLGPDNYVWAPSEFYLNPGNFKKQSQEHNAFDKQSHDLPGMNIVVSCPECKGDKVEDSLRSMIMHLNDGHKMTREYIADWIDKLHDEGVINAEFQPWEESNDQD